MDRPTTPTPFEEATTERNPVQEEVQRRREAMGKWRGRTPTGKLLPGGKKRRSKTRKSRKARRVTRRKL